MPRLTIYYADVPRNKDIKHVLAENVRAVMTAKRLKQKHVSAIAKQRGEQIDQTTVGRIARAEIPTTVEKLAALAAGLGYEPWQLLVPNLNTDAPPALGARLKPDEGDLLEKYRDASGRWKVSLRYMAGLRSDNDQEEVAESMNVLLAKILGSKPFPVEKMDPSAWTRPDRREVVHEPPAAPYKPKGKKR